MGAQTRGEETRSRILEAALECFAQNGYDSTGVAEICERAGVTKGGFYHHFPSKQTLFLELLEQWLVGVDVQLGMAGSDSDTVPERLLHMAGMAQHVFQTASGQLPMFLEFLRKAARDQEIWGATIAPYRRYQESFRGLVEAGVAEGTLRPVDSGIAAWVIVSLAVGLMLQGVLDPQGADWGEVAREGIRMLLEGLEEGR